MINATSSTVGLNTCLGIAGDDAANHKLETFEDRNNHFILGEVAAAHVCDDVRIVLAVQLRFDIQIGDHISLLSSQNPRFFLAWKFSA